MVCGDVRLYVFACIMCVRVCVCMMCARGWEVGGGAGTTRVGRKPEQHQQFMLMVTMPVGL